MIRKLTWVIASLTVLAPAFASEQAQQEAARQREAEIEQYLVQRLGDDASTIRVVLVGTRAVLTGDVQERVTQELAKEVVLSLDDVRSAANRIHARYDPTILEGQALLEGKDAELEIRVKRALMRSAGEKTARQLEVESVDGVISLRGTVDDPTHRDLALKVAGETTGVRQVLDLVSVRVVVPAEVSD